MGPCSGGGGIQYRNNPQSPWYKKPVRTGKTAKDKASGKHARTREHKITAGGNRLPEAFYREMDAQ